MSLLQSFRKKRQALSEPLDIRLGGLPALLFFNTVPPFYKAPLIILKKADEIKKEIFARRRACKSTKKS